MDRIAYTFGRPGPDDTAALCEILAWAFGTTGNDMAPWLEKMGRDNLRVVREGDRIVAQLGIIWMGQYFGGKSIPMAGIAAVGTVPDRRGYGAGAELMRGALRDIKAAGYPLSALYPATQPIYRSVGFEQAGTRCEIRIPADQVDTRDRGLRVEPVDLTGADDRRDIEEVYRKRAVLESGNLDRNGYLWGRIFAPKGDPPRAYRVVGDETEGYVFMTKVARERTWADFPILDVVSLTPSAGRRLLSLIADHRSLAHEFVWHGSPNDPILMLLREQAAAIKHKISWMLRIVDVEQALARRGWSMHVSGKLEFAVTGDPLFPENGGPWTLEVSNGEARVRKGGAGRLKTSIHGLASMYSGYLTGRNAAASGLCEGDGSDLDTASALFAGPAPFMPDMF